MKKNRAKLKLAKSHDLIELSVVLLTIGLFLVYKLSFLKFRFSDGNAYFYMAQQILKGDLPYRDFLLADPPLLPYLLAGVKLLIGQNLILFQAFPAILEGITAFLFYLLLKQKKYPFRIFGPAIYLSSFLILATSDFVTGLHFVNLFVVLALIFDQKKPALSGFFWSLASLIKLYVIPGLVGWLVYLLVSSPQKNKLKKLKPILLAYISTSILIMLPFFLTSFNQVLNYILIHQFNRPAGLNIGHVFFFFVTKDWLLLGLNFLGLMLGKKWKIILPTVFWLVFFIVFKDLYYLYLGVLAPWLSWSIFELLKQIQARWQQQNLGQNLAYIILVFIFLNSTLVINNYQQGFRKRSLFTQAEKVAEFVKKQKPDLALYGKHESTPLVALLAYHKIFDNQIDTNTQLFESKALDKDRISQQAMEQGIYLITQVADIPQNNNIDSGHSKIFSDQIFQKSCQRLKIFKGNQQELVNDIAVYRCQDSVK